MESVPRHIDVEAVLAVHVGLRRVLEIHDLHVWTISSGLHALSAHVVVHPDEMGPGNDAILDDVKRELRRRFGIDSHHAPDRVERVRPRLRPEALT